MPDRLLRLERDGPVAVVTIDRPEKRNALSREGWLELRDALQAIGADADVGGLLLTGAGQLAFAAGADVRELVDRDPLVALDGLVQRILLELEDLPVPTVAALNGDALGGGWELALACDLRVAAPHVRVGFPEVGLGIVPGAGGTRRLLQNVGIGRAKELILSGRLLGAADALALGLVNRVADRDVVAEARALLDAVLAKAPTAVRLAKSVLNATARGDGGWDLERVAYTLAFHTDERRDRMRWFLERRPRHDEASPGSGTGER
jgi:enoyl-CoA hydratase